MPRLTVQIGFLLLLVFSGFKAAGATETVTPVIPKSADKSKDKPRPDSRKRGTPFLKIQIDTFGTKPAGIPAKKEFVQLQNRYVREGQEGVSYADGQILLTYKDKMASVLASYNTKIKEEEEEERMHRGLAISKFEAFLKKHPTHPTYSPYALFKLAELYYQKIQDDYLQEEIRFSDKIKLFNEGKLAVQPKAPVKDLSTPIRFYQRLIEDFPKFSSMDRVYYLLAYCFNEINDEVKARNQFVALIQNFPKSSFVPEAYMRIGEYFFNKGIRSKAIYAYQNVLKYPLASHYAFALYRLGWSYYLNDNFGYAVKYFLKFLEFEEKQIEQGEKVKSELKEEAIQYIANCFAEDDWNSDGLADTPSGMDRALQYFQGKKPYDRQILKYLAKFYLKKNAYKNAILAYEKILSWDPYHEENPMIHTSIVVTYEKMQRYQEAIRIQDEIIKRYSEESEWFKRNRFKAKYINFARRLAEDVLIKTATYRHKEATKLRLEAEKDKKPGLMAKARQFYQAAVDSYKQYLEKYRLSKNTYEINYYLADCLFHIKNYWAAITEYKKVRDFPLDQTYRLDSAYAILLSYENYINQQVIQGKLPKKAVSGYTYMRSEVQQKPGADKKGGKPSLKPLVIPKEELPKMLTDLIAQRDLYLKLAGMKKEEATRIPSEEYKTALLYFNFGWIEKSRQQFEAIISRNPKHAVAILAAKLILNSYMWEKNWNMMAYWGNRLSKMGVGEGKTAAEFLEIAKSLKVGAYFMKAETLANQGKFEESARLYIDLVNKNPKDPNAPIALNNAAVNYEKLKQYEKATEIYERIYREFPANELARVALYRTAFNAERFFNFDKAISGYLLLFNRYKEDSKSAVALYNAALLLEWDQQYIAAAANYIRYSTLYKDQEDAGKVLFQAGRAYFRGKDYGNMLATFKKFIETYGRQATYSDFVLESYHMMAEYYKTIGQKREEQATFKKILEEYGKREKEGAVKAGGEGAFFAARAKFMLTEELYAQFRAIKIAGSMKVQLDQIKKKDALLEELRKEYLRVYQYQIPDWTLAAAYKVGEINHQFSQSLYEVPIPADWPDKVKEIYKQRVEQIAMKYEDKSVSLWEKAIKLARESHVSNQWTKLILEMLHKYKPDLYPLELSNKSPMQVMVTSPLLLGGKK